MTVYKNRVQTTNTHCRYLKIVQKTLLFYLTCHFVSYLIVRNANDTREFMEWGEGVYREKYRKF